MTAFDIYNLTLSGTYPDVIIDTNIALKALINIIPKLKEEYLSFNKDISNLNCKDYLQQIIINDLNLTTGLPVVFSTNLIKSIGEKYNVDYRIILKEIPVNLLETENSPIIIK